MRTINNALRESLKELKESYLEKSVSDTWSSLDKKIRQTSRMLVVSGAMYGYVLGSIINKLNTSESFSEAIQYMKYFSQ